MKKPILWIIGLVIVCIVIVIVVWLVAKQASQDGIANQGSGTQTSAVATATPAATPTSQATPSLPSFQKENAVALSNPSYTNAEVLKVSENSWRMYFHDKSQILSAISEDGVSFTVESGVRLQGQMPATIQLPDGRYRIYYSTFPEKNLQSVISSDGLTFVKEDGVRLAKGVSGALDAQGILHPSIISLPDGSYKLYYDGEGKQRGENLPWRILSASSSDGLTWTKDTGARIPVDTDPNDDGDERDDREVDTSKRYKFEMAFSAHAAYENGRYVLYFTSQGEPLSQSGIWRATSTDGLRFDVETSPLIPRDEKYGNKEDFDTNGGPKGMPQDPFVAHLSETVQRLFYWTSDKGYLSVRSK